MSSSELLEVEGLHSAWGDHPVLRGVSFSVRPRELLVLMGPNGSGKSTLLRCLVGLERPTRGGIRLEGRLLAAIPPHRRGIGMLFQEPALFPGRTVAENIAYGLEVQRWPDAAIDGRVRDLADRLGLTELLGRAAAQLSGGERQKVALARTLAPKPKLVLLDEPFASVDPLFREELRAEFHRVLRAEGVAAIHVTHDREEGLFLADRVMMLFDGKIAQAGGPREVYESPRSAGVAEFLGLNLLPEEGGWTAVAPETVRLVEHGRGRVNAEVVATGTIGPREEVHLRLDSGRRMLARIEWGGPTVSVGDRVGATWERSTRIPDAPPAE